MAALIGIDLIDLAEKRDIESLYGLFIAPGDEIAACPRADRRARFAALLSARRRRSRFCRRDSARRSICSACSCRRTRSISISAIRSSLSRSAMGWSAVDDVLLTIAGIAPARGGNDT
ncbi:MAG: hypothetical protein C3F11_09505 [Methylocystaceae bacterium]|nr:MAG: hypothetical protein C3F11_09505 [Methylocystaceae bacterium]